MGALYQLASDPEEWAEFVRHLALPPSPDDPDSRTLAAMVAGGERVARGAMASGSASEAPAEASLAVLAVSPDGRLIEGNAAAQRAKIGGLIAVGDEDAPPEHRETLLAALARLKGTDGSPRLVRFHLAGDDQPLFAYALAFERLPETLRRDFPPQRPGAAAIVAHAGSGGGELGGDLAEAFGLTPAEVRLAVAICDGASPRDVARQGGLSFYTVRNQLNAVFEKVGVNRRSELILALSELGDIARRIEAPGQARRVALPPGFAPAPRQLRLDDGRTLTYRAYGDPDGRSVLVFHGGLGASLLPPGTDAAARRMGLHIVAPERAGIGRSPASDGTGSTSAAADDMLEVIAGLGLRRPQFVSLTSGAHVALATASAAPDAAARILMLSPRPPIAAETAPSRSPMVALQRRLRTHTWLAETVFAIARLRLSRAIVRQIMQASAVAPGDAAYLASHPETYDFILLGLQEAMSRSARGTAAEIAEAAPHVVSAGPLPTITVFHGAEDAYATPAEVEAWLGPALSDITVFEGIGNYATLKHWTDVLDWLAASNQD